MSKEQVCCHIERLELSEDNDPPPKGDFYRIYIGNTMLIINIDTKEKTANLCSSEFHNIMIYD